MKAFIIIILLLLFGLVINFSIQSGKSEVYQWSIKHNMEIKSIDVHMTQFNTPFYYINKGSYIYKVEMTNGEIWWCRTGIFENDWEKDTFSIK